MNFENLSIVSVRHVDAPHRVSSAEIQGLRLFMDTQKTLCLRCHNGPLFTNHVFHDVGTGHGDSGLSA